MSRPKGSKNKPKVSPLVEEKLEKALDKAREEYRIKKPTIEEVVGSMEFVTPEINEKFIEKYGDKVADENLLRKAAPSTNKELIAKVNAENTNQHTGIVGSFDPSKPDEFYYDPFKNPQFRKKMGLKD